MQPGIMNRRARKARPSRRKNGPNKPAPVTPINVVNANKSGAVLTISFNQSVTLKGTPAYTTNLAGVTAILASMTTPTTLALTFSAALTTATSLIVPFEDPAIRNSWGGFVSPGTFPVT
jgi:hypothetical protein